MVDNEARDRAFAAFVMGVCGVLAAVGLYLTIVLWSPLSVVYERDGFDNAVCEVAVCQTPEASR